MARKSSTPLTVVGKADDKNKSAALEAAMSQIDRAFGKGAVMKLGQKSAMDVESVSTGSIGLDIALGIGESSGKTTLSLHVVAEMQKQGGVAAFIDAEHALDPVYAGKLGVDVNELLIAQPDTGEQGLEIADTLVRSGAVDIRDMGDSLPGLQARLMSQALRKLTGSISKSGCMVIFINQIRMKIGVMYGSPETTTGGNALKFYSSVRLDIRRIGAIKYRDEVVGNQTRVKVVKNKVAPPFRQVEFDIMYGEGISKTGELIDLGVKAEVVENGQGRENVRTFLKDNPDIAADLERKIRINEGLIEDELLMPKDEQVEDEGEPDNVTSLGA